MKIDFYNIGEIDDRNLKFAVIVSKFQDKWVFVRHRDRDKGKYLEDMKNGENIDETAKENYLRRQELKIFKSNQYVITL